MQFSQIVSPPLQNHGPGFSVRSIDWHAQGHPTSPVTQLDHFRVSGSPFGPHPHAGLCAVTYVLRDSPGGLRSRDSLGNDIMVGPGGIVWTQAARGLLHHELPAQPSRELQGLQFFVNLHASAKLRNPEVLWLEGRRVPVWRSDAGDDVYVVVGAFGGIVSPLRTAEPFTLLDIDLTDDLSLLASHDDLGVIYLLSGEILLQTAAQTQSLGASRALAVIGGGELRLVARSPARLLYLSGARIDEPKVAAGPFLMNTRQQVDDAMRRYHSGAMGQLV